MIIPVLAKGRSPFILPHQAHDEERSPSPGWLTPLSQAKDFRPMGDRTHECSASSNRTKLAD
ncbi:MAG: hypothetical protein AAGA75_09705 [Cyanobacteria bacterium P01_E01_bin.6]